MTDTLPAYTSKVRFLVNGTLVELDNPPRSLLLVDYLRSPGVRLMGTKVGCGEGGCGACTVLLTHAVRKTRTWPSEAIHKWVRLLADRY